MIRRLAGAVALGLPVAILAHGLTYGGDHAMGGSCSGFLGVLAIAAVLVFAAVSIAICWSGGNCVRQGSALTEAVERFVPTVSSLLVAASFWFWFAESLEATHDAASIAATLVALLVASFLVRILVRRSLRALAKLVLDLATPTFQNRSFEMSSIGAESRAVMQIVRVLRLFSRPPPNQLCY